MDWISVEDRLPEGDCLVYIEEEALGLRIHAATYHKNLAYIGGHFHFDMPAVTHWMPLPDPPKAP